MTADRDDDFLSDIWKEQNMHAQAPDTHRLRDRERQLEHCATRRNRIEYVAGGIAASILTAAGLSTLWDQATLGSLVSGTGHLAVAIALLWVLARLHRRQRDARSGDPGTPIVMHLRNRLEAERDMLRGAWAWYVAPLIPGFALIYGGIALEPHPNWLVFWSGSFFTAAMIGWIAWLNHRAANRLDAEIARLDTENDGS